eukprot:6144643-Pyramimonas_sp.AAC.1
MPSAGALTDPSHSILGVDNKMHWAQLFFQVPQLLHAIRLSVLTASNSLLARTPKPQLPTL